MAATLDRVALVTGGNRGIGLEICRGLGKLGYTVLLGARSTADGHRAATPLQQEGLNVRYCLLDVTQQGSIQAVNHDILRQHGRLDVLVNNGAVCPDKGISFFALDLETIRETFEVNTMGPAALIQSFAPLMQQQNYGRVVNVSSGAGAIGEMGALTAAYRLSKLALNGLTRIVADELKEYNIKVNAMSPGWVHTRMGGEDAPRTVEEGADTAIWLATLPDDGPTGGFFRDRKPIGW
jgi:NAD(P)-dependent dehydrogenase (short-subunit alcohol dehydrogenase family)